MDTRTGEIMSEDEARRRIAAAPDPRREAHFVRQMKIHPNAAQLRSLKVQRNDPCPCGSERKFKRCCYAGAVDAAAKATP